MPMNDPTQAISVVDEIRRCNQGRRPELLKFKWDRMAENAFAFFRGTDHLFASHWPRLRPADPGPNVLLCGDLHLENFGAYRSTQGDFRYDINDFDEAMVAPCSLDVVRCTASILLAADLWSIPSVQASGIALDFLSSYRDAVALSVETGSIGAVILGQGAGPIWELLGETAVGVYRELLERVTEQNKHGQRRIVRNEKRPDVSEKRQILVREAIEAYGTSIGEPEAFRVLDVTGRILGIGSLGLRRYAVLVAGGGTPDTNRLLDVKEAIAPAVLSCSECEQPDTQGNQAIRIVRAQQQLQSVPAAGLAAIKIDGGDYRVREMIPDENHSKLDRLQKHPDKVRAAMGVIGQLTAWSHLRGCGGRPGARTALAAWAKQSLDAVLSSALHTADVSNQDFQAFRQAYDDHQFDEPV